MFIEKEKSGLFLIVSICMLVQCSKVIDMPLPYYKEEQVMNAFLRQDSILNLSISLSSSINSNGFEKINRAEVVLYRDSLYFDTLYNYADGIYKSFRTLTDNSVYEILAKFDDVVLTASDGMPTKPIVLSIVREDKSGVNVDGYYSTLEVEILDESVLNDYYEIEIIYLSIEKNMHHILYPHTESDEVILNENLPEFAGGPFPFSDEIFNGESIKIRFNYFTPKRIVNDIEEELDPNYRLIIKLRKTSRNYYLYRKSIINHFEGQEPDFWRGIGDPVKVHSNVEGGKGIFAAYNEIVDTL